MAEPPALESEIELKAKELIEDYGHEFVIELIYVFLEEASNRVARLREAVESGDRESWIREAHTLKSGCANLGAATLADLAKEMEFAGRAGKTDGAMRRVEQFEALFCRIQPALAALRAAAAEKLKP